MKIRHLRALLASLALSLSLSSGCGEDLPTDQPGSGGGGGTTTTTSATGTGGAPPCSTNPMTHVEIINACTDAQQLDPMPVLPLLLPDGTLPPLP